MSVLRELTPETRVSFALHDIFGLPFTTVADVAGRRPSEVRELAKAARQSIRAHLTPPTSGEQSNDEQTGVVDALRSASLHHDKPALELLLDPFVRTFVSHAERTEAHSSFGRHSAIQTICELLVRPDTDLAMRSVNGRAGLSVSEGNAVVCIAAFDVRGGRIVTIWFFLGERNLRAWNAR